ncbi:MAG: SpoIVB peptidase [Clostridia bacterium]|nr:SpoIVB peptidase [Clostridia bacterium]
MIRKTAKGILSFLTVLYFVFLALMGVSDAARCLEAGDFDGSAKACFSFHEECGAEAVSRVICGAEAVSRVICGGELFGVRMHTCGLLVSTVDQVETEAGKLSPGEKAGIRKGDVILEADGVKLQGAMDLVKIVSRSGGSPVQLLVERDGKAEKRILRPALSSDGGGYKAGLWVRDGAAGIGTVTFRLPEDGTFAGLGHAVCDGESGKAFPLGSGLVCRTAIEGITKGENGSPGELRGRLTAEDTGTVLANTPCGIYGREPLPENPKTVEIARRNEVKTGKATLFCTLNDKGKQEYEIEIEEIFGQDRVVKNFVIRVTDPALLNQTGGIVQGMSGSPIIQNGKLIGAVTHVLVGDPTRGYGIFIENMLSGLPE